MNILFVNEKCGSFGGVEQNIAETAAALTARGHRCTLAHSERTGRDEAAFLRGFAETFPWAEMAERTKVSPPDVVYLHKVPRVKPLLAAARAKRSVRMVHDHDLCCPRRHKYYAWTGRVCSRAAGWCCLADLAFLQRGGRMGFTLRGMGGFHSELEANRAVDQLLVGSRFMRDELLTNRFSQDRVTVLHPVTEPEGGQPSPCPVTPRVLFVGQVIHGKGVDLLLHALADVTGIWSADIIGTGNGLEKVRRLCGELGLADRVTFHGWVDHRQLGEYYRQARVVVVPSRWPEPFGMVGLEAMRLGRPVAGFAVGGIPDWLDDGKTGLLAGEQDVPEFAVALTRLLHESGLAERMGAAGRQRAEEVFSFTHYIDRLEQILGGTTT
jgi:glycosyltransferase involved in cell wall biosynthesis